MKTNAVQGYSNTALLQCRDQLNLQDNANNAYSRHLLSPGPPFRCCDVLLAYQTHQAHLLLISLM